MQMDGSMRVARTTKNNVSRPLKFSFENPKAQRLDESVMPIILITPMTSVFFSHHQYFASIALR